MSAIKQTTKSNYSVPKVQEKKMPVPAKQGGNTDIKMATPARKGPARNPASSSEPMFQREFNAEKDFGTIMAAKKAIATIASNKSRMAAAMKFGLSIKNAGGAVNEKKGANN